MGRRWLPLVPARAKTHKIHLGDERYNVDPIRSHVKRPPCSFNEGWLVGWLVCWLVFAGMRSRGKVAEQEELSRRVTKVRDVRYWKTPTKIRMRAGAR